MSSFFMQHVGEALSIRDFPRSLGARPASFLQFGLDDLLRSSVDPLGVTEREVSQIRQAEPFQVWGLPEGAKPYTDQMFVDDHLMLLGSEKTCEFIGRIVCKIPRLAPDLSFAFWRETKFPWIVLLNESDFIDLPWAEFLAKVGYSSNYYLRGKTSRVSDAKLAKQSLNADSLSE